MKPIGFTCRQLIHASGVEICAGIADTTRWSEFSGYGPLPGIESASYETCPDDMLGARIRVRNRDGSEHIESIYRWQPGVAVAMKLHEFTPPLSRLATHFTEEWSLQAQGQATLVTRRFQMFPVSAAARPLLWLISLLFRRAIDHHLAYMAAQSSTLPQTEVSNEP